MLIRRRCRSLPLLTAIVLSITASRGEIELRPFNVDLPGTPSSILAADVNEDGRPDLVVVSAFTEVGSVGEDRIEDMVQISTVIPAAFDRREVRVWFAGAEGDYPTSAFLELPATVHSLEPGPGGWPAVALTDDGVSVLRATSTADEPRLSLQPVVKQRTALAGTEVFLPDLRVLRDLDGDGEDDDLLLPTDDTLMVAIDPAAGGTLVKVTALETEAFPGGSWGFRVPWPQVVRVDEDAAPDLVFFDRSTSWSAELVRVFGGDGEGKFHPLREPAIDCHDRSELRWEAPEKDASPWPPDPFVVRDLDGDGRAELVLRRWIERPGKGMRAGMKDAKRPRQELRFHRMGPSGNVEPAPYATLNIEGHLPENFGFFASDAFVDLDGDDREELVTMTLRFSMLQVVRVMVSKRLSIGVDFHVYRQDDAGQFAEVEGLDLEEKLKLNLNDLSIRRIAQFAGDFDGDGMREFVHFGRGRDVTFHLGRAGCNYSADPDASIQLAGEPDSLDLIRVGDFDDDGRSDIAVVQPRAIVDPDASPGAQVTFYLSGGAR